MTTTTEIQYSNFFKLDFIKEVFFPIDKSMLGLVSLLYLVGGIQSVIGNSDEQWLLNNKVCFLSKILLLSNSLFLFFSVSEFLKYYFFIEAKKKLTHHKLLVNSLYFVSSFVSIFLFLGILKIYPDVYPNSFNVNILSNFNTSFIRGHSNMFSVPIIFYFLINAGSFPMLRMFEKSCISSRGLFVIFLLAMLFPLLKLVFCLDLNGLKENVFFNVSFIFILVLLGINAFKLLNLHYLKDLFINKKEYPKFFGKDSIWNLIVKITDRREIQFLFIRIYQVYLIMYLMLFFYLGDMVFLNHLVLMFYSSVGFVYFSIVLFDEIKIYDEDKKKQSSEIGFFGKTISFGCILMISFSIMNFVGYPGFPVFWHMISILKELIATDYRLFVLVSVVYVLIITIASFNIFRLIKEFFSSWKIIRFRKTYFVYALLMTFFNMLLLVQ